MCFLELVHNSDKCKRIGWANLCKCSKTRPGYCRGLYQEYRENCYCLQVKLLYRWSVSFSLRKNFKIKGALTIAPLKASFGPSET